MKGQTKVTQITVSTLVFDGSLYPRGHIDDQNVTYIREAIQAETTLPPLVVCRKTKRIVDGAHRAKAYRLEFGDEYRVSAFFRDYEDDQALFLEAIRLNADHGQKLTRYDRAHIAVIAKNLKIDAANVANALHMTCTKFDSLVVDRSARLNGKSPRTIPIKRTIRHMAGQTLTKRQWEANERLSGMNQRFYVEQLITLIESELLDTDDEALMKRLGELAEMIGAKV